MWTTTTAAQITSKLATAWPNVLLPAGQNLSDRFVPFSMEQVYARRVAAAGLSDLVIQRAIRGVGHCDFTAQELVTGFTDLVRWVEADVKPAGDDVLTPAVVARRPTAARSRPLRATSGPFTAPCP